MGLLRDPRSLLFLSFLVLFFCFISLILSFFDFCHFLMIMVMIPLLFKSVFLVANRNLG